MAWRQHDTGFVMQEEYKISVAGSNSAAIWNQRTHKCAAPWRIVNCLNNFNQSFFQNTNYNSSFYVIAPDWTSEGQSIRKTVSAERSHFAWDNRPAVQPLRETSRDTYLPLLQKRARNAQAPVNEFYKSMVNHYDKYAFLFIIILISYNSGCESSLHKKACYPR